MGGAKREMSVIWETGQVDERRMGGVMGAGTWMG